MFVSILLSIATSLFAAVIALCDQVVILRTSRLQERDGMTNVVRFSNYYLSESEIIQFLRYRLERKATMR